MKTINNYQLWSAGFTNDGRAVSPERVEKVFQNTVKAMADGFKPIVKIGSTHASGKRQGTIVKVTKDSNSLIADIEVEDDTFEKLQSKKIIDNRSVEIGKSFVLKDGNKLDEVLAGVLVGVDIPAQHYLNSVFGSSESMSFEGFESFNYFLKPENNNGGNEDMEFKELYESEMNKNKDLEKRIEALEKESKTQKEEFARLSGDDKKTIESYETKAKKDFFEGLITGKRMIPAKRQDAESIYDVVKEKFGREEAEKKINAMFEKTLNIKTEELDIDTGSNESDNYENGDFISAINRKPEGGKE
jgi:DNA-binding transcriptional regulator YiaG